MGSKQDGRRPAGKSGSVGQNKKKEKKMERQQRENNNPKRKSRGETATPITPDRSVIARLADPWCESVEAAARKLCNDDEGARIIFYWNGRGVTEQCKDEDAVDCLREALERHQDSMDTLLVGVYEEALEKIETRRKVLRGAQRRGQTR